MAIQHTITEDLSNYGISFNNAYYRIVTAATGRQPVGESNKFNVMIDLSGYATNPGTEEIREVDFKRLNTNYENIKAMSGSDFIQKCYQCVLTQPEFSGGSSV